MKRKEILEKLSEDCYVRLQEQIDRFYKLNGELQEIKGRIEGRKMLEKIVVGTELIIDTSIWQDEEWDMIDSQDQLKYLEKDIREEIAKIKEIEILKKLE